MPSGRQRVLPSRMKLWRGTLLAGSLLFIAVATLTPGEGSASGLRPDFWCLGCGPESSADATLNIALFMPFGISLALLGVAPARTLIFGLLLTAGIEAAQWSGIVPSRVAALSDLLSNAAGALIGGSVAWYRVRWLQPTPKSAPLLAAIGTVLVAAFLGFTGWALGPVENDNDSLGAPEPVAGAFVAGYGWYQGRVSGATVNGQIYSTSGNGPLVLRGARVGVLDGQLQIEGRDARDEFVPFFALVDASTNVQLVALGQQNTNAQLRVRTRATRLRFSTPTLRLRDGFTAAETQHSIRCTITPQSWTVASGAGSSAISETLPVTLSIGWTLFQTVVHVGDRLAPIVTMLWLFLLWLPVGYWCCASGRATSAVRDPSGERNLRAWQFVTGGAVAMVLTLVLVPRMTSISPALPVEWGLSAAGLAVGAFLALRFYNYIPSQ